MTVSERSQRQAPDTQALPSSPQGYADRWDFRSLSVVIPVFNEEGNIPPLLSRVTEVMARLPLEWEVLVVDDGSGDGTYAALVAFRDSRPESRLKLLRLRRNFGQTAALAAGFAFARGEVVVTLDGDLQNHPEDIPLLLDKLAEGYDIVSGWRVQRQDAMLLRKVPSAIANRLISWVSGVHLHDTGCALKAYRREVVQNVRLYGEMHRYIPALASWMGVRVAEIPVRHSRRLRGRSKYGLDRTSRVLLDILTLGFLLSFATRPMQIFGFLGAIVFGIGSLLGLYLVVLRLLFQEHISGRPLLLLAVLLVLGGIQLVTTGLLGEMVARVYHEGQRNPTYVIRERAGFD